MAGFPEQGVSKQLLDSFATLITQHSRRLNLGT
jgi:hypothetical protein